MAHTAAEVRQLPVGRALLLDERGVGLRATWHHDRGFANLSVWRDDRCVETFHLSLPDAAELIGFLATGLGEAAQARHAPSAPADVEGAGSTAPTLSLIDDVLTRASAELRAARRRLASWLAP